MSYAEGFRKFDRRITGKDNTDEQRFDSETEGPRASVHPWSTVYFGTEGSLYHTMEVGQTPPSREEVRDYSSLGLFSNLAHGRREQRVYSEQSQSDAPREQQEDVRSDVRTDSIGSEGDHWADTIEW